MKHLVITAIVLLLGIHTKASQYRLTYEPSGQIIAFRLGEITFITDTAALFNTWLENSRNNDFAAYHNLRRFILHYCGPDTISFFGSPIAHYDTTLYNHRNWWHIEDALQRLIAKDRMKILLPNGTQVNTVTKREESFTQKQHDFKVEFRVVSYFDKRSGILLFQEGNS
ncbi:MAG: hypothetical protein ACK5W1_06675 [Flavobacteriales bacterium]